MREAGVGIPKLDCRGKERDRGESSDLKATNKCITMSYFHRLSLCVVSFVLDSNSQGILETHKQDIRMLSSLSIFVFP